MQEIGNVGLLHPCQFCQSGLRNLPRPYGGLNMLAKSFLQIGNEHWGAFSSTLKGSDKDRSRGILLKGE